VLHYIHITHYYLSVPTFVRVFENLTFLCIHLPSAIYNISSTYAENHTRQYYNFYFTIKHCLENSRKGKVYSFHCVPFFPDISRHQIISFPVVFSLFFYLQVQVNLVILLRLIYWPQILFVFFHLRRSWFPLHFSRVFLLDIDRFLLWQLFSFSTWECYSLPSGVCAFWWEITAIWIVLPL
jgi:hypothetical protein